MARSAQRKLLAALGGVVLGGASLGTLALTTACGEAEPDPLHVITFTAFSDPGEGLAGVQVATRYNDHEQVLGTTDATGNLRVQLRAPYGTTIPITATCPPHHRPPLLQPNIAFRPVRTLDPAMAALGIEHSIQCLPEERNAVVIVRATGATQVAHIPVIVDGREVGTTDEGGVFHYAVSKAPNSTFRIELGAATISPYLQPPQPARDFTVPDQDLFLAFDQPFTYNEPPPARRRVVRRRRIAIPARTAPVRIGGRR